MPRYFFTIRGRDRIKDDHYGTNLPDVAAALSIAESKIRELRKESGYNNDPTLMVTVKDETGHTVLSLPFFPGLLTVIAAFSLYPQASAATASGAAAPIFVQL